MARVKQKPIKFDQPVWEEIDELAKQLAQERGASRVPLQNAVAEAIKFYKLYRKKPAE